MENNKKIAGIQEKDLAEEIEAAAGEGKEENTESPYYLHYDAPYLFEGEESRGVDLSGMETMSTMDLLNIENTYYKIGRGCEKAENPESTLMYAMLVANTLCSKPFEYFCMLPAKEGEKLKDMVRDFFL